MSGTVAQTITQAQPTSSVSGTVVIISPSAGTTTITTSYGTVLSTSTAAYATNGTQGTVYVDQVIALKHETRRVLTKLSADVHYDDD